MVFLRNTQGLSITRSSSPSSSFSYSTLLLASCSAAALAAIASSFAIANWVSSLGMAILFLLLSTGTTVLFLLLPLGATETLRPVLGALSRGTLLAGLSWTFTLLDDWSAADSFFSSASAFTSSAASFRSSLVSSCSLFGTSSDFFSSSVASFSSLGSSVASFSSLGSSEVSFSSLGSSVASFSSLGSSVASFSSLGSSVDPSSSFCPSVESVSGPGCSGSGVFSTADPGLDFTLFLDAELFLELETDSDLFAWLALFLEAELFLELDPESDLFVLAALSFPDATDPSFLLWALDVLSLSSGTESGAPSWYALELSETSTEKSTFYCSIKLSISHRRQRIYQRYNKFKQWTDGTCLAVFEDWNDLCSEWNGPTLNIHSIMM